MMGSIIAIDPGRDKCGVAILSEDGTFAEDVIKTDTLCAWISESRRKYSDAPVIIGNGTGSQSAYERLRTECGVEPLIVEEYKTTEEARKRYWKENPPAGWRRLLPISMQVPPVPVDGYVAVILAERYQNARKEES